MDHGPWTMDFFYQPINYWQRAESKGAESSAN